MTTISTVEIERIIGSLKNLGRRQSTRKNYYTVWKCFNEFYLKLDRKPDNWEDRLVLFTGYLVDSNKQSQTIRSYISAIKAVLRDDGLELNEDKYLLNSLTKACRYRNDKVQTRLPISNRLLDMILDETENHFLEKGHVYLCHLYKALFATAYYGLLRVGESLLESIPLG